MKEISTAGGKAIGFAVDVAKRAEVEALIQRAVDSFGRVDVMVNDAGIMPIAPLAALKVDEWDRMIDVNIKGLLYRATARGESRRSRHPSNGAGFLRESWTSKQSRGPGGYSFRSTRREKSRA